MRMQPAREGRVRNGMTDFFVLKHRYSCIEKSCIANSACPGTRKVRDPDPWPISMNLQHRERTMRLLIPALIILIVILPVLPACAHVPEITGGDVIVVPDAEKSYAWYGSLEDADEADQYLITADAGTEIRLSVSSPDQGVRPSAALIGPGITAQDPLPGFIEVPEGQGSILIPAAAEPELSYEPFTPMAIYDSSSFQTAAPAGGDYTIVVFGDEGRYILATGFLEEFSLAEWVFIPVSVLSIRIWQGQPHILNLLPILCAVLIGAWWFRNHSAAPQWPGAWLLAIAGFAYAGSGVLVIAQMMFAGLFTGPVSSMILTTFFAAIPLLLGFMIVRIALKTGSSPSYLNRGKMAALGIIGLFFWAGLIAGPVLAIAASILPGNGHPVAP